MKQNMDEIILLSDAGAAMFASEISGWVDRHGRYFGKDEKAARWSGATHNDCPRCATPKPKSYMFCEKCMVLRAEERYAERPTLEWDGDVPLYSYAADRYFFELDELADFLGEYPSPINELQLVVCEQEYFQALAVDYFDDQLEEDQELPVGLAAGIAALNAIIETLPPLGWVPGKFAAILSTSQARSDTQA